MTFQRRLKIAIIFSVILFLIGCDPGHYGKTSIRNESSYTLELNYQTRNRDTSITIQPHAIADIYHFGGLGSGKDYGSCIDEFSNITLQPSDTSRTMTKAITDVSNWTMINPNTRRFSNKEINCEFVVTESDVQ